MLNTKSAVATTYPQVWVVKLIENMMFNVYFLTLDFFFFTQFPLIWEGVVMYDRDFTFVTVLCLRWYYCMLPHLWSPLLLHQVYMLFTSPKSSFNVICCAKYDNLIYATEASKSFFKLDIVNMLLQLQLPRT